MSWEARAAAMWAAALLCWILGYVTGRGFRSSEQAEQRDRDRTQGNDADREADQERDP